MVLAPRPPVRHLMLVALGGLLLVLESLTAAVTNAEIRLPALFTDHMVLQREQANLIWGWAEAGQTVTIRMSGKSVETQASDAGRWQARLPKLPAGGPHQIEITADGESRVIDDVLVGEVWICSGQSNMAWPVKSASYPKLEIASANLPRVRLISVPQVGTQKAKEDFEGAWQVCSPQTVGDFSAVGYFFGRQLHTALDVPIGLIDNAWGGSACEAWIRRDLLEADERFEPLLARWEATEATYKHEVATERFEERLAQWQQRAAQARQAGQPVPNRPRPPRNPLVGQHRPANLYNGVLKPTIGYGIKGAIWYQGEANAARAYQYRELFPLMISSWREEWQQGDFPFYWVQLADFRNEVGDPAESDWAELREAQTMTLDRLPNTGQAVIIDLGEAQDIHPRNKQMVAKRLVTLALAKDYGFDIEGESPRYDSMQAVESRMVLKFKHTDNGLKAFDVRQVKGFTIAGEDRVFVPAQARLVSPDTIEVWSDEISAPVAVRYGWADNPVCNVYSRGGLPLTPFRTDDWPGITVDKWD